VRRCNDDVAALAVRDAGAASGSELDELTLARAKRGDGEACRALVRRYEVLVFAMLGRMLTPRGLSGLVDDLAQEAFLRVFRALPDFDPRGSAKLSTWILCITSRLAINELKRRRPPVEPISPDLVASSAADGTLTRARQRDAIARALGELSAEQQAAFVLHQFHGFDDAAVAAALGIEVGAVKSRLHRARTRLRAALAEVDR
jgi:RNA polymerase sigma-70 factor (ECF subfamily)